MKYEFTGKTQVKFGVTLRQVRYIATGVIGGWIEKEYNLSQRGDARVYGNALVWGDAMVWGDATVWGDALVWGDAQVYGDAMVWGKAQVWGDARVYGNARVGGKARVYGVAMVGGKARVYGVAMVGDNAVVGDKARVYGVAMVGGNARVYGDAMVGGNADLLLVGPIGSRKSFLTVTADAKIKVRFTTGCFSGSLKDLQAKLKGDYSARTLYGKQYRAAIALAKICVKAKKS